NMKNPEISATTNAPHVQGRIASESSVTRSLREARPSTGRSTIITEPRTRVMAMTCTDSNAGNIHDDSRMPTDTGHDSSHWNKLCINLSLPMIVFRPGCRLVGQNHVSDPAAGHGDGKPEEQRAHGG